MPSNKIVTFEGNASFVGTIYAPQADLNLKGSGNNEYDFLGACVVNTVKMNGHFHFHYDLALRKQVWKGYMPTTWNELNPNAPVN